MLLRCTSLIFSQHRSQHDAVELKKRGAELFAANKPTIARKKFKRALAYVERRDDWPTHLADEGEQLALSLHLNIGATYQKTDEPKMVIEACTRALDIDPNNVKALYRRALAYVSRTEWDDAEADLRAAVRVEPVRCVQ